MKGNGLQPSAIATNRFRPRAGMVLEGGVDLVVDFLELFFKPAQVGLNARVQPFRGAGHLNPTLTGKDFLDHGQLELDRVLRMGHPTAPFSRTLICHFPPILSSPVGAAQFRGSLHYSDRTTVRIFRYRAKSIGGANCLMSSVTNPIGGLLQCSFQNLNLSINLSMALKSCSLNPIPTTV